MSSSPQKLKPNDDTIARMVAASAVQRLRQSERGQQALLDFRNMLDNGGYGLDTENWNALNLLCRLGEAGKSFAIDEQFQKQSND